MAKENRKILTANTKDSDSRWVALDLNNNLISEGKTPEEANDKAKKLVEVFSLMFVPKKGVTYIF